MNAKTEPAYLFGPETAVTLPWSQEAEQSVLGGLMLDGAAFSRVSDLLHERSFWHDAHRTIWTAIAGLTNAGRPADILTVFDALQTAKRADECGGMTYLHELVGSVMSAANIRAYADIVVEKAGHRAAIEAADRVMTIAKSGASVADKRSRMDAALACIQPQAIESSLSVAFADELPDTFDPPDELVQGVLTAEGGSVLYGDSNSGKTFFCD